MNLSLTEVRPDIDSYYILSKRYQDLVFSPWLLATLSEEIAAIVLSSKAAQVNPYTACWNCIDCCLEVAWTDRSVKSKPILRLFTVRTLHDFAFLLLAPNL